ncbi:acetate--CoA ligase family protein [Streptomyces sp. NEAU-Y11]|uniref:acetate--CoA ligase family protein n=1 Tax=Streptomyces cucumeris TaxID=2962890 RepID=UPI0020C9014F|nr:acetate--CoA ligase family protein [Streptomyces sp. NEAU-Y11]MCP9211947.1 acetate--CoA ligase family protein [Streptomyces sp. NEAU-Y11]
MPITSPPAGTRRTGLAAFRDPASVAVVGASANPSKWGYWLARGALAGRDRRTVHLVTRGGGEILGAPTAASLGDLPEVPELVALCVPAAHLDAVVDEALELGVRGLLGITAAVHDERRLAAKVAAAGARMIGPSSLGLFDAATSLHIAWGDFTAGGLAVVSQSGQVGSEIALLSQRSGLGISRFVSVGSQLDVTMADLLEDLVDHELTRAVGVYLESFHEGGRVFDALRALRAAGKPVVLLAAGDSEAGARAARSHTSALTSPMELVDAACRAAGALRVPTPAALVDVAAQLLTTTLPTGPRVAVVSDSGGQGALAADRATRHGLTVPELGGPLASELARRLPDGAATANPVDLAGGGERDLTSYRDVVAALLGSGDVDSVVLTGYFGTYGLDSPPLAAAEAQVARELGELTRRHGRPLLVHSMGAHSDTAAVLRAAGVPVFATIDSATTALAGAHALHQHPGRPPYGTPAERRTRPRGFWDTRALLRDAGIAFPAAYRVHDAGELEAAAGRLHPPYVLKASWLEHKSEAGGVVTGLQDTAGALRAFTGMHTRLGDGPYVLEEQDVRADVVEVIVGARRDARLGPMVMVGAGGTEAELHRDVVTECAPVDAERAHAMIRRLRCAPLLAGWRGRPATDIGALADVVAAVSRLIAQLDGSQVELEINPLRVAPDGALAVDALLLDAAPGAITDRPDNDTPADTPADSPDTHSAASSSTAPDPKGNP